MNLVTGKERREPYDKLLLAPGASPIRPPLPGLDLPGVFCLRTIPDAHHMRDFIQARAPEHAVVVGGGFTGLEVRHLQHASSITPTSHPTHTLSVCPRRRKTSMRAACTLPWWSSCPT